MKKTFQIITISLFGFLLLSCGGTICDDAASYITDDCGVSGGEGEGEGEGEVDCSDGTQAACQAQCTLDAPCSIFDGSLDPTCPDTLKLMTDYSDCVQDC